MLLRRPIKDININKEMQNCILPTPPRLIPLDIISSRFRSRIIDLDFFFKNAFNIIILSLNPVISLNLDLDLYQRQLNVKNQYVE